MRFSAIQLKSFVMYEEQGTLTSFTLTCLNAGQPSIQTEVAKKRPIKSSHSNENTLE